MARIDAKGSDFNKIKSILPTLENNSLLLDVGSGFGHVTDSLIANHQLHAVELNKEAIEVLKSKGFLVKEQSVDTSLDFQENYFNTVFLLDILEHLFNPLFLLRESKRVTQKNGYIIVSVPLYFDLIDRLRILLSGSIISYDNKCYGEKNYNMFRSYNYDHIRFFRPKDIFEMGAQLNLSIDKVEYTSSPLYFNSFLNKFLKLLFNRYTANWYPNLFAHSMIIRFKKL
jgi:2-polyprenyl-3-methyl-5-hydroxy-6-metoxy-1,4-benzoquinol methylase